MDEEFKFTMGIKLSMVVRKGTYKLVISF